MAIHPTSVVHPDAHVDATAEIGPFCVVGAHAHIGPQTKLLSHVVITNHTYLGARNVVHAFACLGGPPQDLKYRGEASQLIIGDDNIFRENVTLNIGTKAGHMQTRVGNGCLLMAYAHVAHDCTLGNGVILANSVGLAGHVTLGDQAILGGLSAIHQFCRIGRLAFIGGGAMVAQDVPPFMVAQGDRAMLMGLNTVGLRRAGWQKAQLIDVRRALHTLFSKDGTRQTHLDSIESTAREGGPSSGLLQELHTFVKDAKRGICRLRQRKRLNIYDD